MIYNDLHLLRTRFTEVSNPSVLAARVTRNSNYYNKKLKMIQ